MAHGVQSVPGDDNVGVVGMKHGRTWLWWALSGAVVAWLLWMTLRPNPTVATDLAPLTEPAAARGISPRVLISLVGNVVVFVPLGAALALALGDRPASRRLLLATLIGASLSLGIELAQTAIPSRVTALDDLLLNTAGTALGALVGSGLETRFFSEKPGSSSTDFWPKEKLK